MLFSRLVALVPFVFAAPAPLYTPREVDSLISDQYIVKFKEASPLAGLSDAGLDRALTKLSAKADRVYNGQFKGFAGKLDAAVLKQLREHPDVEYVEQDAIVSIAAFVTQNNAPWNLARISHRARGFTTYVYDDSAGRGSCVYILDTGISATHPQFGGRAIVGANFAGGAAADGNGHGTAVAGIVGSTIYGVAKRTTIIGVKVLGDNGSGAISQIIAGFNYVSQDSATRSCPSGVIINISLGGGFSAALNSAAAAAVRSGKLVAVAAGNGAGNVANFSPASEPLACTVGATTANDAVSISSNYGPGLDVWAPGQNILTTWLNGGTQTLSGSSLAVAHIAGLGAYLATLEGVNPGSLCARIQELATPNILTGVPAGTRNLLIFNGNPTG
ncbi:Subtilisin-like serine protease AsES [Paramyrothecium foliicola]|nr:Subtilisin-like serine protease AsES [Paramyrothecium foliicola]